MLGLLQRSLVAFVFGTLLLRSLGKKSTSKLNYLDFLMVNLVANSLNSYVTGQGVGAKFLLPPATFVASTMVTEKALLHSRKLRKIIEDEPLVVISKGKILEHNMKKARFNLNELFIGLRQKNVFNISEVEYAVLEADGRLSVLKRAIHQPVTPKDMGLPTQYKGLPAVLVSDGQVIHESLKSIRRNSSWLDRQLANQGIHDIKEVFLAILHSDGTIYVDKRKDTN